MGFLDFMKRTPPPAPQRPTELDELFNQKSVDIKDVARKLNLAPQAEPFHADEDLGMPEPLDTADPYSDEPPQPKASLFSPSPQAQPSQPPLPPPPTLARPDPETEDALPAVSTITLPDFTDEEIAMLEGIIAQPQVSPPSPVPSDPPMRPPALPPMPEQSDEAPEWKARLASVIRASPPAKEEIAPPPAPAAEPQQPQLIFLSAIVFFAIRTEISGMRTALREADTSILDAASRHEQTDEKMRRFAAEINAVQERLTMIDEALFEE